MNNEGGLVPTNIADIIDKLNQSLRKFAIKETEWIIQKSKDDTKMAELEGKLKAHENINIDLLKRIRMLEYALSVERTKNAKLISAAGKETDVEELKFNNKLILSDIDDKRELLKEEDLKALKQKSIRPSLLSMLNDIGINEQLANSLFVDLELNKTELERLIKSNMDEKFEEIMKEKNEIETNINNNVPEKDKSQTSQNRESQADNKNSESISSTNERKEIPNLNLTNAQQTELRSHFDVVRKLGYLPNINALVSISEDCSIQVWSLKNLNFANTCNDIDPYIVFRGHTGPLFSLALSPFKNNLIYTAGNEGIIKVWKVPKPEEVAVYGDADLNFNCNVGFFNKSNEVVWDLIHHPNKNLLISLNADSFLYLWETAEAEDYLQSLDELNHEKWFKGAKNRQPMEGGEAANPTCGIFMNSDPNLFICGFNDGYLSTFDIVKTQFTSNLKTFKIDKNDRHHHDKCFYQPNCLTSGTLQTVYGGFEDSTIKSFDLRSADGISNTVNAHNDAVTSLSLLNDLYLFSTSHDTKIKMWDVRNLSSCVQEKIGSQKKWDEAIWHSVLVPNEMILATAGADSWITLFKL